MAKAFATFCHLRSFLCHFLPFSMVQNLTGKISQKRRNLFETSDLQAEKARNKSLHLAPARFAQLFCAMLIAARFAIGYAQKLLPYLLLECCPTGSKRYGKIPAFSTQVFIDLPSGIYKQHIRTARFPLGHLFPGNIQFHDFLLLPDQTKPPPAVFP